MQKKHALYLVPTHDDANHVLAAILDSEAYEKFCNGKGEKVMVNAILLDLSNGIIVECENGQFNVVEAG